MAKRVTKQHPRSRGPNSARPPTVPADVAAVARLVSKLDPHAPVESPPGAPADGPPAESSPSASDIGPIAGPVVGSDQPPSRNPPESHARGDLGRRRRRLAKFFHLLGEHIGASGNRPSAAQAAQKSGDGDPIDPLSVPGLSPRVQQTLRRLAAGDSEKQIAARMGVSPHTVHVYVKALYRHFDVCSRGELLALFVAGPATDPAGGRKVGPEIESPGR